MLERENSNMHIVCRSKISRYLKIDQSIAHNGVCLTVVDIQNDCYTVTAIQETLEKTNLGTLEVGSKINIERSIKIGSRIDGHMVQGHVDQIAKCIEINKEHGSHIFDFRYKKSEYITVEKGSICVNGVSLTVINSQESFFSVAIIPHTYQNTTFHTIKKGDLVNIEFDILGKYISRLFINDLKR